ncbi:TetR/AcrR family transcriptional regulator [Alloiococcus sp. CFN-8]|uniref:TetR/AcrR family transcriptional regulator n=1 Tax=Alloiococcus sp. CFN-8 TaxID=3416081 RepID=UPI003CF689AD
MTETKTDPRVLRTKKLIINAFIILLEKKEFKLITIKDITNQAAVNRATFYYHFTDKYNLMEEVIRESFRNRLFSRLDGSEDLNVEQIEGIFTSLTNLQENLFEKYSCKFVSFIDIFERVIKDELHKLFISLLEKKYPESTEESLNTAATLSSWSIYGAAISSSKEKHIPLKKDEDTIAAYVINGIKGMLEIKAISNAS